MTNNQSSSNFQFRHIGISDTDKYEMLKIIGLESVDELIEKTIPRGIRSTEELNLDSPVDEYKFLLELRDIALKNKLFSSYIGMGYYSTITPSVIKKNILQNPGWYTQYTPYQAEISQGRLEALLNFQTLVTDLDADLPIANASLLDESTAAAEAMSMLYSVRKGDKKNADTFLVSDKCFPQTIDVLKTRAEPFGIKLKFLDPENFEFTEEVFGMLIQFPGG